MNNDENIIFFDTETTGVIPKGKEEPLVYFNDFPHVVQLSWKLGDKEGDFIIKPDGFTIPDAAAAVHGITTDRAIAEGVPYHDAFMPPIRGVIRKTFQRREFSRSQFDGRRVGIGEMFLGM
jgi:DNA polymerase III epsilon subunit-like protein